MASIRLQVQMGGAVARLSLCRPEKYNAFDREMLRELGEIVRGVGDSKRVRVVAIEGEGEAFCAGGDLKAAVASDSASNYLGSLARAFHAVLTALASCPALVVTVVNGPAAGGGASLALAGDIRLGTPAAKFRAGYGRAGLTVDGGLSWRLPRLVGMAQAQRILFEDPDLGPEEAVSLGLLHRIVAAADVQKAVEELAARAQLQSRSAIARNRELLLSGQGRTLAQSFEAEAAAIRTAAATSDGREGVRAFVEKRAPRFTS
jgi:2-(1,2-epoxy-1,2-dihydrophenyl)acetyl-CoA isomerase